MLRIGVLSDTHLAGCTELFRLQARHAFANCQAVIHAGDLTDMDILSAFPGIDVYAVHGNMCNARTQAALPHHRTVRFDRFTIGICHGAGSRQGIEDHLLALLPAVDCIVFGHTHRPMQTRIGAVLLVNPGSFAGTGRYGAPGTYAILTIGEHGISAAIHELPALP